jgi:hypothetical protein
MKTESPSIHFKIWPLKLFLKYFCYIGLSSDLTVSILESILAYFCNLSNMSSVAYNNQQQQNNTNTYLLKKANHVFSIVSRASLTDFIIKLLHGVDATIFLGLFLRN